MAEQAKHDNGALWQCDECGVARPILDDDWSCDCPVGKQTEAFNWRKIRYQVCSEKCRGDCRECPGHEQ